MADDDALTVTGEVDLADRACWDSLESSDAIAFARLSAAGWDMRCSVSTRGCSTAASITWPGRRAALPGAEVPQLRGS